MQDDAVCEYPGYVLSSRMDKLEQTESLTALAKQQAVVLAVSNLLV